MKVVYLELPSTWFFGFFYVYEWKKRTLVFRVFLGLQIEKRNIFSCLVFSLFVMFSIKFLIKYDLLSHNLISLFWKYEFLVRSTFVQVKAMDRVLFGWVIWAVVEMKLTLCFAIILDGTIIHAVTTEISPLLVVSTEIRSDLFKCDVQMRRSQIQYILLLP